MLPLLARVPPRQFPTRGLVGFWDLINVQGDPQTVPSLYGGAYPLQRGATAGAEASDGAFGASGWVASGDDFLKATIALANLTGPFTAVVVMRFDAGSAYQQVMGQWQSATDTPWNLQTTNDATPLLQLTRGNNAGGVGYRRWNGPSAPVGQMNFYAVRSTSHLIETQPTFWKGGTASNGVDIGDTGTGAAAGTSGSFYVGMRNGAEIPTTGVVALMAFANVAWTEAEIQRAYRAMKAAAAAKGVAVL